MEPVEKFLLAVSAVCFALLLALYVNKPVAQELSMTDQIVSQVTATPVVAPDGIVLSKEDVMKIEEEYAQYETRLTAERKETHYWFGEYQNLKKCIQFASKKHVPTLSCIGYKTF
jgi:hypothetical protein